MTAQTFTLNYRQRQTLLDAQAARIRARRAERIRTMLRAMRAPDYFTFNRNARS